VSVLGHSAVTRFRRAELAALSFALAWSVLLIVAANVAPAYTSQTSEQVDGGAVITHRVVTKTLVEVNGTTAVVLVALPLLITITVWTIFWLRTSAGVLGAAWTVAGLLALVSMVGMLTIGPFILPVAAALLITCGIRTSGQGAR
jgi:hypothetical protein